jgi:predicted component of type VI protein secretion system
MRKNSKRIIWIMITLVFLAGCQALPPVEETGTLQVNVTWQTDVWKPGPLAITLLPDTEVQVHKIFSAEIYRVGVTDLLGVYRDETLPAGWYWVEAYHHPEGVQKSDYGKHWVAHFIHIRPGQEVILDFGYQNAGGWKIY